MSQMATVTTAVVIGHAVHPDQQTTEQKDKKS